MRIAFMLIVSAGVLASEEQVPVQGGPQGKLAYYDSDTRRWVVVDGAGRAWDENWCAFFCDRKLFVWGPREGEIEYYDFKHKAWYKIEKPPLEARRWFAVGMNGPKFAIWGGQKTTAWAFLKDGAIYDCTKRKWEPLPEAPEGRYGHDLVWVGRRIVVWGGYARGAADSGGAVFDTETKKWRKMSDSGLKGRYDALVIGVGNKVMVWGGKIEQGLGNFKTRPLGDGAMYDPESDTWEKLPRAPLEARSNVGATVIGSAVYVFGGLGKNQVFKDAAVYDVSRRAWRRLPEMPISGRCCPVVAQAGTKIYVWGGYSEIEGVEHERVLVTMLDGAVLDTRTETWEKIEAAPFKSSWWGLFYR